MFARKLNLSRTKLQRLESKAWGRISIEELERIAYALDTRPDDLLLRFNGFKIEKDFFRSGLKNPYSVRNPEAGIAVFSLIQPQKYLRVEAMRVAPQKTLSWQDLHFDFLFLKVVRGVLTLNLRQEYILKEGECFSLLNRFPFELANFQPLQDLTTIYFLTPTPTV